MGKEKGKVDKNDQVIMCVRRSLLFSDGRDHFQGFCPADSDHDFYQRALRCGVWVARRDVEDDPNYKQIIPYVAVVNPKKGLWTFQRATKEKDYQEKRLAGKWSVGVGGHTDKTRVKDPIKFT